MVVANQSLALSGILCDIVLKHHASLGVQSGIGCVSGDPLEFGERR